MKNKAIIIFLIILALLIIAIIIVKTINKNNTNQDLACEIDTDCPIGVCPDGSTYSQFSCLNNECNAINYIRNPCEPLQ